MKNIFFSLVCFTVFSANAMKDKDKTLKVVIEVLNYKNANWCQKDLNLIDAEMDLLYQMDEELALQHGITTVREFNNAFEKDFSHKRVEKVVYDSNENSIVASLFRQRGEKRVITNVIKHLEEGRIEIDYAYLGFKYMVPGKANPVTVGALKAKIAEFESTLPKK